MGTFLNPDDLSGWAQATPAMIAQAIADVEAKARRVAPCLFRLDWDGTSEDRELVVSILRMAAVSLVGTRGGRVKSHTTGPFSEEFRDGASGLSDEDIADLKALCGASDGGSGWQPKWSFPGGRDYGSLFPRPTRRLP